MRTQQPHTPYARRQPFSAPPAIAFKADEYQHTAALQAYTGREAVFSLAPSRCSASSCHATDQTRGRDQRVRRSTGNDEPRHVYISFVESSALEPKAAVEAGRSRVGINPPPASIQLNIQRLKGKAKQVADVQCRVRFILRILCILRFSADAASISQKGLLVVADSLEEGISDLFSELERESTTKCSLRKETRLLEAKFAEAQKSETGVVRLRGGLGGADANYKSAVSSAEEALGRVQGQAVESGRRKTSESE